MPSMRALARAGECGVHIVADDDGVFQLHPPIGGNVLAISPEELRRAMAHLPGGFFVERTGINRANIVSFENLANHETRHSIAVCIE